MAKTDLVAKIKNFFWDQGAGFSLVEVIVSLFIIVTVLIGAMTLISSITSTGGMSASKLIAANLAQEGIEVVRNIRDLNFGANGWDDWYASISGVNNYLAQYNDPDFRAWQDIPLKYNSTTGLYGYDAGVDTPFAYKRKIILTKNPSGVNDNEIKVEAVVSWTEHNRPQTLTVEDRLWNWR